MSHSVSEPDSASLHKVRAANLPKVAKPSTDGEAAGVSSREVLRGDWGWRVLKDRLRNLGGPTGEGEIPPFLRKT